MERFAQAFWAELQPFAGILGVLVVFFIFAGGMALIDRIERK